MAGVCLDTGPYGVHMAEPTSTTKAVSGSKNFVRTEDSAPVPETKITVAAPVGEQWVEDMSPAPKAVAQKAEMPEPKVAPKVAPKAELKAEPPREKTYKLNMRRADGQLRGEISKATVMTIMAQYGDLLRSIPSNRFATMEEIVQQVWEVEKRSFLKGHPRTRKQIEDGVRSMVDHNVVVER